MKTLILPQLRQTYEYDCGANALQSVLVYFGVEIRKEVLIKQAKTTKKGTEISNILNVLKNYGLKVISKKMTIQEVKGFISKKIPVILLLQAWTEKKNIDWENNWDNGHYVVAIGYTKDTIIFNDPASFVSTYLSYDELEKRWHDIDIHGKKYFHHGIAVFGKTPTFLPDSIVHMD